MQNVVHSSKCDSARDKDINDSIKDHSGSSSPLTGNTIVERGPSLASLQSHFMAEISESDDDEISEVESFILEQDVDEDTGIDSSSKFLLAKSTSETVFNETACRLEALLEASNHLLESSHFDPTCSASTSYSGDGLCEKKFEKCSERLYWEKIRQSSLAEACTHGDINTVKKLLEEGRNVNEVTEDGESLLSLAASSGYFELAQLLLAMKANVEDRGLKDMTPLMEAANAGNTDIVKLLIQHGADVNAQTSQEKKLKGAKVKNQDMNMKSQQEIHGAIPSIVCPEGNTPLMFACAAGHVDIVRILLDAGARVEDHNENGHTPLMEAASAGHVEVAKLLVERGASINTHSNEFKESALTLACYKGHLEMVRFLLEAGADREHKTDEMHTALMEASMDGHVEVARLLLDSGAQVNMPADSFESPLTLAACGGHVELAMLLLDRGANIEEVNDEGYTPLMEAAREGHEEMVALLLSQGADINAQTEETQETALTLACCGGFLEVADFLIKAGADIELGASTPLMEAAQEGHLELVRYLINAGANVNATTATGDTALTYACENGHTDVADLLLQAYAKLEHESEGGRTPLMKAARAGHLCTVQFLISKGANVNKQTTNNDHTPLSLACAGGHLAVVELLLANGADPTHKLKDNSTMLIEAAKGGHTAVVQMLLDYPSSMLASPPPPPDLSQIPTSGLENNEAPRVPPHGLQVFHPPESETNSTSSNSYLANVQAVPRIQDLLRESLPTTPPQAVPKQKTVQRRNTFVKNNEAPSSSVCESSQRYHYRSKSNAAAQANSLSIQAETSKCLMENELSGGGGTIESAGENELKPSERLEQCINSMMKKAEMLNPSPEEQIIQKQQILEELQRVERELQEKAHAQIMFNAQQQQQQPNMHALGTIIAGPPALTAIPSTSVNSFTSVPGGQPSQPLLINSGTVLDFESLSSLTDISSVSSQLGLHLNPTSNPVVTHAQQMIYQNRLKALQEQQQQQSTVTTTTTLATEYCKSRPGKPIKQAKSTVMKQVPQQLPFQMQTGQLQNEIKIDQQSHPDSIEKINLRNIVLNEQQQQHNIQLFQQSPQLFQSQAQQQFVLSEFSHNVNIRGSDYCKGALAGIMHAMGGIKLTTDSTQTPAMPIYDPVQVGQALLQQQHMVQQHQQLTQVIQQETKRQQNQQQQQQPSQQQHHFEKNVKLLKGKTNKVQQSHLHANQQPSVTTLQQSSQPQQVLKQQLSSSCGETCTLVGNIPIDGTGVLTLSGMATPAFPVSIAVSPVTLSSPVSISASCGASFTHNLSLDEGLMVAAPARTLHETLGEIVTAPTTQLAGTHMNLMQPGSHCSDACLNMATSGGKSRILSMSSLPGVSAAASLPMTFHTLTPPIAPCVPLQVSASTDCISHLPHLHTTAAPSTPAPPIYPPLDLNSQTDSNHDTALTLACAGGHEELVTLLLSRGADIEHRDKKGFAPLMLAATAGHAGVVDILLNNAADIEAPAERTKDTALSLACSGGRYEVVDILLARGANKEHRNVSDYTPLSLAASGGYVNIIKLLLSHGAEINSRTGSKLGISPLMLAAMNGHVQAVKLLLDMGSDINAQIETNRNTALTLACFQGRNEVVSLLLDRKANVEHRAKTGLTPLMEAASGGYVEVGKVLLDKGADVNAPPVPSSRDTALTIAADKGHYRFVQLLLERSATVEVKNKKGNSPLWLAANGGHLEVVQLLYSHNADIDSQDNRKVSCLMAAFRKGHVKVVKWMVKHVNQFPSDQDLVRFMSTLSDKEMIKKCNQCADAIRIAKERQAAEANKNANILLEELDLEKSREENRKAAAARRRERKRKKKREKQEQVRAAKAAEEQKKCEKGDNMQNNKQSNHISDQSDAEEDEEEEEEEDEEEEEEEKVEDANESISRIPSANSSPCKSKSSSSIVTSSSEAKIKEVSIPEQEDVSNTSNSKSNCEVSSRLDKRREREKSKTQEKNKRNLVSKPTMLESSRSSNEVVVAEKHALSVSESVPVINMNNSCNRNKKRNQKPDHVNCTPFVTTSSATSVKTTTTVTTCNVPHTITVDSKSQNINHKHYKTKDTLVNGISGNSEGVRETYQDLCAALHQRLKGRNSGDKLSLDALDDLELPTDVAISSSLRSPSSSNLPHCLKSSITNSASPKKWPKRDEGWKEVVRSKLFNRSKKVSVPANAISRVIGRGGMNINAIREASGAHIEVEKQKGQGDRTVIIRGSAESTRIAQQLITALIKEPEKDLSEILSRHGISRATNSSTFSESFRSSNIAIPSLPCSPQVSSSSQNKSVTRQQIVTKTSGIATISVTKTTSIPPPSLPANATPPFTSQIRSVVSNTQNIRPGIPVCSSTTPPFLSNGQNAWTGVVLSGKMPATIPRPSMPICTSSPSLNASSVATRVVVTTAIEKSPSNRQLFSQEKKNAAQPGTTTSTKTTVSYTMAVITQGKAKTVSTNIVSVATKVTTMSDTKVSTIAPLSIERAGSAPPSSSVAHSQMTLGHNTCSGPSPVQPFSSNQSPKLSNSSLITQQGASVVQTRIHVTQAPVSKPFVNSVVSTSQVTATTTNPPSTSPSGTLIVTSGQSSVPLEYLPFNSLFASKVPGPIWPLTKEKEASKPNFASVAASGVTSVASQIQNSNPVQSTLTLSLPQNSESDLIVDAAKAPGYRGNLHISPSACSNSSASSNPQVGISHNSNFGPIGSGPRSAPCTPPLGPIGPPSSVSSSTRLSTPPAPSSPPSAGPHLSRSLPESQSVTLNELPRSLACAALPSHLPSQLSETLYHHQGIGMSSHLNRLQSYPMASTLASPGGTNTTFSQNTPLSSVGNLLPEGASNGNMQVVQSNLNPNAPDFSSRASLLMAQHGPPMHHMARMPSGPNNFQDNAVPHHLAAPFRPILASGGGINPGYPLHAMANAQAQAAINRFGFHLPNHQQQTDFNPNNATGTIGSVSGLSQEADTMPLLSMVSGYHPPTPLVPGSGNIPHYQGMQTMMGMRPNQRSSSTTPSVGTSSKDEGSPMAPMSPSASPQGSNLSSPTGMNMQEIPHPAGAIGEDRKLPRPIGMERAQKKNPTFGGVSDGGIWSFNSSGRSEIPADWIHNMQNPIQPMQQEETGIPPSLHSFSENRFQDMISLENHHPADQHFQPVPSGGFPFMNGLHPQMMNPHMYQNNAAVGPGQVDGHIEMWNMHQKVPLSSGSGDGLPQNIEHKMTWQNWSPHQV
ncbi:Ankyrin repeat domain-containing protein 17 [Araneus ventricosus]|uniref:Ankyrin repeat domain-containing protein 17 n=1 Tax=Araneus ventricosus TaxID=182803 RepID=A0A4Y2FVE3_ARAVE|nr:Ankyrin repeat domain-containing protein 17 [Araneus ventricosus]